MNRIIRNDGRVIYTQTRLTKYQKEAGGLMLIGTFLEYFDLMLYIHMAVLLNYLFFPKQDPFTTSLFVSFTFCITYIFRPMGALLFGWLGDNIGRKTTVIITTFIMTISCSIMATLPTYVEIGAISSCIMLLCRIMQGVASMGEIVGAELYLTETIRPPIQYPVVASVAVFGVMGGTFALVVATFITTLNLNWRYAFVLGGMIAFIGFIARTTLRETPDFADAKRRIAHVIEDVGEDAEILKKSPIWQKKVNKTTALSLFLIQCSYPLIFYFSYIHCATILEDSFGFTPQQIIRQNLIVSFVQVIALSFCAYLSYKIYPLKILKVKLVITTILFLICPYLLDNITSSFQLLLIQLLFISFVPSTGPALPVFYSHLPVFKRYTYGCFMYALGRTVTYTVTSFGLIYLVYYFNNWGVLFIALPILCGYKFGISHFENLEKESGNYQKNENFFCL